MKKSRSGGPNPAASDILEFSWDEVAPLLMKARGIKTGLWSFGVRFNFGAVNAGGNPEEVLPTGVLAVRGLSLRPVESVGPLVFDADQGYTRAKAGVEPPPKTSTKSGRTSKPKPLKRLKVARPPKV